MILGRGSNEMIWLGEEGLFDGLGGEGYILK